MAGVRFGEDKDTQLMSLLKELNILKAKDEREKEIAIFPTSSLLSVRL